jgi:hypothetical protein
MIDQITLETLKAAQEKLQEADRIMGDAGAMVDPIFKTAINSNDIEYMKEILKVMPCAFYRAELRGYIRELEGEES